MVEKGAGKGRGLAMATEVPIKSLPFTNGTTCTCYHHFFSLFWANYLSPSFSFEEKRGQERRRKKEGEGKEVLKNKKIFQYSTLWAPVCVCVCVCAIVNNLVWASGDRVEGGTRTGRH